MFNVRSRKQPAGWSIDRRSWIQRGKIKKDSSMVITTTIAARVGMKFTGQKRRRLAAHGNWRLTLFGGLGSSCCSRHYKNNWLGYSLLA